MHGKVSGDISSSMEFHVEIKESERSQILEDLDMFDVCTMPPGFT